jgi:hypothetical protein
MHLVFFGKSGVTKCHNNSKKEKRGGEEKGVRRRR